MSFSAKQVQALRRQPDRRYVRTREANGRKLSYLEGWYAISEANRIFGFDGWSRETVESRCVLARENRGAFLAVYTAKVRITVQADGVTVIREGHGSGEGRANTPGEVHDTALKSAETDATKRALATFGRPVGLELYKVGRCSRDRNVESTPAIAPQGASEVSGLARSIGSKPPVRLGADSSHSSAFVAQIDSERAKAALSPTSESELVATSRIDKSALTFGEPKRIRDKTHLKFVASQPCLICGRQPSDAHHLRFAQPRALGRKVSDEFTVPLCRGHHREVHHFGNEPAWWEDLDVNAIEIAKGLWEESRAKMTS